MLSDDDSVEFLEDKSTTSIAFPHLRIDCVTHKFVQPLFLNYCVTCYCYVCDVLVSECQNWEAHCQATNVGSNKEYWKKCRETYLEEKRVCKGKPAKKKSKTMLNFFQPTSRDDVARNSSSLISSSSSLHHVEVVVNSASVECSVEEIEDSQSSYNNGNSNNHSSSSINAESNNSEHPNANVVQPIVVANAVQQSVVANVPNLAKPITKLTDYTWAVFVGPRCSHRGTELLHVNEDVKEKGLMKFIHCSLCATYEKSSHWAEPRYRRCDMRDFRNHNVCNGHLRAVAAHEKALESESNV